MAAINKILQKLLPTELNHIFITVHNFPGLFVSKYSINYLYFLYPLIFLFLYFYSWLEYLFNKILFTSSQSLALFDSLSIIYPNIFNLVKLLNFTILKTANNILKTLSQGNVFIIAKFDYLFHNLIRFIWVILTDNFLTQNLKPYESLIHMSCFLIILTNRPKNNLQNTKSHSLQKHIYSFIKYYFLRMTLQQNIWLFLLFLLLYCMSFQQLFILINQIVYEKVLLYLGTTMYSFEYNFIE